MPKNKDTLIRYRAINRCNIFNNFLIQTNVPVFADWLTGVIRVPDGVMFEYIHSVYFSVFEKNMFLEF